MKPTPLTSAEISDLWPGKLLHYHAHSFAHAISAARDAQWQEMLSKQEPVAWSWTYTRLDGHKEKRILWVSDYKDAKGDLEMVLRGAKEPLPLYAAPQPAQDVAETDFRNIKAKPVNQMLLEALKDAYDCVEHWAGYVSVYFRKKHDIDGDLARIDAAIAAAEGDKI